MAITYIRHNNMQECLAFGVGENGMPKFQNQI